MESSEDDVNVFYDGSKLDERPLLSENTDDDKPEIETKSPHHGLLRHHGRRALLIIFLLSVMLNVALCMSLLVYIRQQPVAHAHSTYGLHFQH